MWRTASASLVLTVLAYAGGAWLTMDYQVWTAEGARRLAALRSPLAAPTVAMRGPGIRTQPLREMLRNPGTPTIVDFVYTRCITLCSALSGTFQQLQDVISIDHDAGRPTVQLLSISFDPEHDTPDVLAAYGQQHHANASLWRFAAPVQVHDLQKLLQHYGVIVIPDGLGGYEHNAALLVLDSHGRLMRIYDYDQANDALALARYLADNT